MAGQDPLAALGGIPAVSAASSQQDPLTAIGGIPATSTATSAQSAPSTLSNIGGGIADAASDVWGAVKNTVSPKAIWDSLPPVQLADSTEQVLPLINEYEKSRASGGSISDAIKAADATARQHASNIHPIDQVVAAFKANPTRATARTLTDAAALASSMFFGAEGASVAPEAEVAPAAEAVAATKPEGILSRINPFRTAKEAKLAASQPGAAGAVRTVAGAGADTPILQGDTTVLDDSLNSLATNKAAAYKKIDDTVGFDLKAEKLKLKDTQYAVKQPGADTAGLQAEINDSTKRIADANTKLAAAKIDPKSGDVLNTSWEAGKSFKNVLTRATAPDGSINVDQLLSGSKNLRFNKWGDRLAQFMGKGDVDAGKPLADAYIEQLQGAQKAGVHAMKVNNISKWVGGIMGSSALGTGTYEGVKKLLE
jgi:hypothetical protein